MNKVRKVNVCVRVEVVPDSYLGPRIWLSAQIAWLRLYIPSSEGVTKVPWGKDRDDYAEHTLSCKIRYVQAWYKKTWFLVELILLALLLLLYLDWCTCFSLHNYEAYKRFPRCSARCSIVLGRRFKTGMP